jgi:hypothetical protein
MVAVLTGAAVARAAPVEPGGPASLWEVLPHRVLHQDGEGPGLAAAPRPSAVLRYDDGEVDVEDRADVGQAVFRKTLNVGVTACTTCSGLSFCTTGGMACWTGACLGLYGVAYRQLPWVVMGALGVVGGLILVAMTAAVFLPLAGALRFVGLWDTWTERFIVETWRLALAILL